MDKHAYLEKSLSRVEEIVTDNQFRNQLYQVRARAIQEEFGEGGRKPDFTFETDKIWRYCNYVFTEATLLLREKHGDQEALLRQLREIAEAFEFLSRFAGEEHEEILLISSSLCYQLAGYQANALCLARFIEEKYLRATSNPDSQDLDQFAAYYFRYALIEFLKRDIYSLRQTTTTAIHGIHNLQQAATYRISEGEGTLSELMDITGQAYFHEAFRSFIQYCISGTAADLNTSKQYTQKSSSYFKKAGDVRLGTITAALVPLIEVFNGRSTWEVIRRNNPNLITNRIWQAYLRNLALDKSIVEFWPAQLTAIKNGILNNNGSYIVQMPTSAGKTFVAELAILSSLTNADHDNPKCLYIAPYRALVNEVEAKLADTLGAIGFRVSTLIGGFEFDSFQEFLLTNSDVVVATPEKSELLFRTHPEFFEGLSLVVIDEGHIVDEGVIERKSKEESTQADLERYGNLGRGVLLEFLITRLKIKHSETRFLFVSAVMPSINARDFAEWLTGNNNLLSIDRLQRPSRQVLAKFEWLVSADKKYNGQLEYTSLPPLPNGKYPFVPYFLSRTQYFTGELTPKQGKKQTKIWPTPIDNKVQSTALLAAKFARSGPTLVFCAQRDHTASVIENLITVFKYFAASDLKVDPKNEYRVSPDLESYGLARAWLGDNHILTQGLRYGVGLHIGPLPDPLRQAIEDEFKEGKIRILVSTNTLGQGVNLPLKTVVIHSLERSWPEIDESGNHLRQNFEQIKRRDFWNICGRAGRAGKETEGQVVFVNIGDRNKKLFTEYQNPDELEEVESALIDVLMALIEQRISQNDLIDYIDPFILSLLAEEVVGTEDERGIEEFLNRSLVGIQALRKGIDLAPLTGAMHFVSKWITTQVDDKTRLKSFASTGLRLNSCQTIHQAVVHLISDPALQQLIQNRTDDILYCNDNLVSYIYQTCANIAELKPDPGIDSFPSEPETMFKAWIGGTPIQEIRTEVWDGADAEDFSKYISDQYTYKLPWVINGFLQILATQLQEKYEDLPQAWQQLPSMVKYGVNDVISCWAGSIGVNSRSFAKTLSDVYLERHGLLASFTDFAAWVSNLPHEFVVNGMEGNKYEKQRFLNARNRLVIDRDLYDHIRNRPQTMLAEVRGIAYEHRQAFAANVKQGDVLQLDLELDNEYDPFAVKVLSNDRQIGYVQRDKARIISKELQIGRSITARVSQVTHPQEVDGFHTSNIQMIINIED